MADFCVICAAPRTGTTFLEDAVARAFGAAWPHEIFHERFAVTPENFHPGEHRMIAANFFAFRTRLYSQNPALSLPSLENSKYIYNSYIEYMMKSFKEELFILDIKYNSWSYLDWYWRDPTGRPGLAALMQADRRVRVVHLKRRNLFAQYCSQRLAERSGLWWRTNLQDQPAPRAETLEIDVTDCVRWLEDMAAQQQLFDKWFAGFGGFQLEYETLMQGDGFAPHVEKMFREIFGRAPVGPLVTEYRKVAPPLGEIVTNGDRVLAALAGTRFEPMLRDALARK